MAVALLVPATSGAAPAAEGARLQAVDQEAFAQDVRDALRRLPVTVARSVTGGVLTGRDIRGRPAPPTSPRRVDVRLVPPRGGSCDETARTCSTTIQVPLKQRPGEVALPGQPTSAELPVRIRVTWSLHEAPNGPALNPLAGDAPVLPGPGGPFIRLSSISTSFLFQPALTAPGVLPPRRIIQANLTLSAGPPPASGPLDPALGLPTAPIVESLRVQAPDFRLVALPVPTLLVLFKDKPLKGPKMIVVAPGSGIASKAVAAAELRRLATEASALGTTDLFPFFSPQRHLTPGVIREVAGGANFSVEVANRIENLNAFDLQKGTLNNKEVEDEISSLIAVGPPGTRVQLFNARGLSAKEGQLDVTIGPDLVALVRDLHAARPVSEPSGRAVQVAAPAGRRRAAIVPELRAIRHFGDEISSLRFVPPPRSRFEGRAVLSANGRRTRVSGPVTCDRGLRARIDVRMTLPGSGAVAEGTWRGVCRGVLQRWRALVRLEDKFGPAPALRRGRARACAVLTTAPRRRAGPSEAWCATVRLSSSRR